jgi:hypothetical protein
MKGLGIGVATTLAALALGGCGGSTHTTRVTVTQPIAGTTTAVPTTTIVNKCAGGVTTTTSCVFATNVRAAFVSASARQGAPPKSLTVRQQPLACSEQGNGEWRCVNGRNTMVWVMFPVASAGVQTYSGNGSKKLGTITVATDSTVAWSDDGGLFQTIDKQEAIGIDSQAHRGTSDLPAGTYEEVEINAAGNWTFRITPK